jgi:tRNA(fMet)-specific endonuclease VapC
MMYLLDTNICVYFISNKYPKVTRRFYDCEPEQLCISSLVAAELAYGVENSARVAANRINLEDFLKLVQVLPWNEKAMWHYARQKTRLWKAGAKIGELDLLLGSQALALDATFVTKYMKEFKRLQGLRLENWV